MTWRPVALLCLIPLLLSAAEPVPIGYYGPADPTHPVGGTMWQGVLLAVEEANAEAGYRGRRFRIVQEWDDDPWSGGAAGVVRMAYEEDVVAIVGGIDGDSTHLAEQVVAKALVPLVDPASTDRSVNAAFVPWMFSVMPDDRSLMRALVEHLPDEPFVLVTSTAHDSRMVTKEFLGLIGKRRPERHVQFDQPTGVAAKLAGLGVGNVVLLAGALESAALVRDLRTVMPEIRIHGGPAMGRRAFLLEAGEAADGVTLAVPSRPDNEFTARFTRRYGHAPDYAAQHAYDAMRMVLRAIREAGADREGVREALLGLSPYAGVSGLIGWDELRRNSRAGEVGTNRDGAVR